MIKRIKLYFPKAEKIDHTFLWPALITMVSMPFYFYLEKSLTAFLRDIDSIFIIDKYPIIAFIIYVTVPTSLILVFIGAKYNHKKLITMAWDVSSFSRNIAKVYAGVFAGMAVLFIIIAFFGNYFYLNSLRSMKTLILSYTFYHTIDQSLLVIQNNAKAITYVNFIKSLKSTKSDLKKLSSSLKTLKDGLWRSPFYWG